MKLSNYSFDVLSNTISLSVIEVEKNRVVAELEIWEEADCYVLSFKATDNFKYLYNKHIDDRLAGFFWRLRGDILAGEIEGVDANKKQILLLDDEVIASRYAIVNDLKKVPRYCGYYFIN